jgi:hypothetical protein
MSSTRRRIDLHIPVAGFIRRLSGLTDSLGDRRRVTTKKIPVPGLVPGIHAFLVRRPASLKTWVAGTSPATGRFWLPMVRELAGKAA